MRNTSGAKTFCMVLAAFVLSVMLTSAGSAAIGVKEGDWIKYDYTVSGAPFGTVLPTWLKMEFLSVEGTNATVRTTIHMSDGTEQSDTMTIHIVAGEGTIGTVSGFVIPANRTTGDSIYITEYGNITIAGEIERTYAGARRTVVHTSFLLDGTQQTYYWDKQTGIMVEESVISIGITITAKAADTNMWKAAPPPFWMQWWFWAIVGVAIVASSGAITRKWFPGHEWEIIVTISTSILLIGVSDLHIFIIGVILVGIGLTGLMLQE